MSRPDWGDMSPGSCLCGSLICNQDYTQQCWSVGEHKLVHLVLFEPEEEHLWKGNSSPHSGLFNPCLGNICFPSHGVGGVAQLISLQLQLFSPYLAEGFACASLKLSVIFEVGSSSGACKNTSSLLLLPVDMHFSHKHTVYGERTLLAQVLCSAHSFSMHGEMAPSQKLAHDICISFACVFWASQSHNSMLLVITVQKTQFL